MRSAASLRGYLLLLPALLLMLVLLGVPLLVLVTISFWTQEYFDLIPGFSLQHYAAILDYGTNPIYLNLLGRSLLMAGTATAVVVIASYPIAYFLAFRVGNRKLVWIILLTIPFWTSYLLRIFAWKIILGFNGVINSALKFLGVIDQPLEVLLYNPAAVTITLTHAWAAYAVLPIYVSLDKIDRSLLEAASDLGDSKLKRFLRVTLPLSAPGVIAASLLVFIPTVGDYVTPTLVGGSSGIMMGNLIQSMFGKGNNAPLGAALAVVMMMTVTLVVCLVLGGMHYWRRGRGSMAA
jgi:spermidine/putrescine transport system permease protein